MGDTLLRGSQTFGFGSSMCESAHALAVYNDNSNFRIIIITFPVLVATIKFQILELRNVTHLLTLQLLLSWLENKILSITLHSIPTL